MGRKRQWVFQEINEIMIKKAHNEGESVVAEGYIRTLKNKIDKYITWISKNVYIDQLDDTDETINTIHSIEQLKWNLLM